MNQLLIGRVCRLHPFQSWYLHPNYHCCQALQSNVRTLLTSLMSKSQFQSWKRSVFKTSNAFLRLDFQELPHFRFVHKDNANGTGKVVEVLYCYTVIMRVLWDCTEISLYDWTFASGPARTFSHATPSKGLNIYITQIQTCRQRHTDMCACMHAHKHTHRHMQRYKHIHTLTDKCPAHSSLPLSTYLPPDCWFLHHSCTHHQHCTLCIYSTTCS